MKNKPKICLTCSAGGHFQQMRLATDSLPRDKYDFYWLMMESKHLQNFFKDKRLITVTNTEVDHKWTFVVNALQSLWYLLKERPHQGIGGRAPVGFYYEDITNNINKTGKRLLESHYNTSFAFKKTDTLDSIKIICKEILVWTL